MEKGKKFICRMLFMFFLLTCVPLTEEVAYAVEEEEVNMSNLVVFVNFADTALEDGTSNHAHSSTHGHFIKIAYLFSVTFINCSAHSLCIFCKSKN